MGALRGRRSCQRIYPPHQPQPTKKRPGIQRKNKKKKGKYQNGRLQQGKKGKTFNVSSEGGGEQNLNSKTLPTLEWRREGEELHHSITIQVRLDRRWRIKKRGLLKGLESTTSGSGIKKKEIKTC